MVSENLMSRLTPVSFLSSPSFQLGREENSMGFLFGCNPTRFRARAKKAPFPHKFEDSFARVVNKGELQFLKTTHLRNKSNRVLKQTSGNTLRDRIN